MIRVAVRRMSVCGGAVALGVLAGCADGPRTELARRAQAAMVGMSKAEILACAGVPTRQATAGGNEYLTYVAAPVSSGGPSTSIGVGGGSGGVGIGLGFGIPLSALSDTGGGCEATVTLVNDVVQRVVYPAGASMTACAAIVQTCVPP